MAGNYEITNFDTHMPIKCIVQTLGHAPEHKHEYFEIDMMLEGRCDFTVDGRIYTLNAEDVISIDGHVPHEIRSRGCVLVTIQFDQSIFEKTLPTPLHPEFNCNSALQGESEAFVTIRRIIAGIVKNNADQQRGYELRNWSLIYQLMDILFNNFRVEHTAAQEQKGHRYASRISEITQAIKAHYNENYSLAALAEQIHLSVPYLSKFFDRHFGMTFLQYLTQYRLEHAVGDLLNTEKTIEEISLDSGFPNSHAFVQAFRKEYELLPSVYRRQSRMKRAEIVSLPTVEQHDYMRGLRKYLDAPHEKTPAPQSVSRMIRFSAAAGGQRLSHTFRNVMTVGSAQDILVGDVQEMIGRMQREIGFKYIKFSGIFSDDLRVCTRLKDGGLAFNFAYLDKIFDYVLSERLKPFIQLSYMPFALAKKPEKRLFNSIVSEPKSLSEWNALVTATVGHLLSRYGVEEVGSWLFCVWNQPDTPERLYGFSSDAAFYQFYQTTYNAVKGCSPLISFGTPPTFYIYADGYRNWYLDFIAWCEQSGCVPDFLNFAYYDTTLFTEKNNSQQAFGFVDAMSLSKNENSFSGFVRQVLVERRRLGYDAVPVYLTEWNNTPSQQDLLNDTCFRACYIVKNILNNYDKLYSFGYWSLTDLMGEAPIPQDLFFGGLGLFTVNGVPKASFYALRLLAGLGDELVGNGEGWFATRKKNEYRVLLYNYRHYSDLYAMGERFDMTFTDRYTTFEPNQTLDVHLSLTDLEDGDYLVKETVLNRENGSAFDLWVSMGALPLSSADEVQALKEKAQPTFTKYVKPVENGVLELDAILDMLEIRLVSIARRPALSALPSKKKKAQKG